MEARTLRSRVFSFFILCGSALAATGQSHFTVHPDSFQVHQTIILDGDTLPRMKTIEVPISASDNERSRAYMRKYERLKDKVIEVYPLAEVAALLLDHYEDKLKGMNIELRQKAYMKKVERDLKKEFKDEIKGLTISEGRVLMKLIDRETGNTSYEIIEELRGDLSAFFWQSVARVFGSDLKTRYDPSEEDRIVEAIVLDIKSGELEIPEREPESKKVKELLKAQENPGRWWKLKG